MRIKTGLGMIFIYTSVLVNDISGAGIYSSCWMLPCRHGFSCGCCYTSINLLVRKTPRFDFNDTVPLFFLFSIQNEKETISKLFSMNSLIKVVNTYLWFSYYIMTLLGFYHFFLICKHFYIPRLLFYKDCGCLSFLLIMQ